MKYNIDTVLTKKIKKGWINDFFNLHKKELEEILEKVQQEKIKMKSQNKYVFPFPRKVLKAFTYFEPSETRVVLLFQDPFINFIEINNKIIPQAMGLATSVPKEFTVLPPTLKNIFKELESCIPNFKSPKCGDLTKWAKKEKILLLNSALTVNQGASNSHKNYWTDFTNNIIIHLSQNYENIVFILLGNPAKEKQKFINTKKHLVFTGVHPSPLSASNGFFGCQIFKKVNDTLTQKGKTPINWNVICES
jgi:uracil-DNA glycosylase